MAKPPTISLAVVGAAFPSADGSNRQFEILLCKPGEPVEPVPEPKNKFDEHAVAVYSCRAVQIGYVSAERASRIGALLAEHEVHAVFQRRSDFGAWIRVSFDGAPPMLTEAMLVEKHDEPAPISQDDPDFYPDECGDD